jgi:acyl-CoA thioesterase I
MANCGLSESFRRYETINYYQEKEHMDWHLDPPFWKTNTIYGESLFFIRETPDVLPDAPLLFRPGRVLAFTAAAGTVAYVEGSDYTVDAATQRIVLPPGSRIPFMERAALYCRAGDEHAIDHKVGEPDVKIYYGEEAHFHGLESAITYTHNDAWAGSRPGYDPAALSRTAARLRSGQSLTVCLCGDSISFGWNASRLSNTAPYQPAYGHLVTDELARRFGSRVAFTNLSVSGEGVAHGVRMAPEIGAGQPDLVLLAYGMNNAGQRDPEGFRSQTAEAMAIIRQAAPQAEFVLIAPMLGNPEWVHTPTEMFPLYRDALASLCGPGVALADLTQMWTDLLARKRYHDLTGNGVNHPNDFGHRVYAQVVLEAVAPRT